MFRRFLLGVLTLIVIIAIIMTTRTLIKLHNGKAGIPIVTPTEVYASIEPYPSPWVTGYSVGPQVDFTVWHPEWGEAPWPKPSPTCGKKCKE